MQTADSPMSVSREGGRLAINGPSMAVVTGAALALCAFIGYLSQQSQVAHLESMASREREMALAMERIEKKQDAISALRIDQCHSIQEKSIATSDRLADVIGSFLIEQRAQAVIWGHMSDSLETIEDVLRDNGRMISNMSKSDGDKEKDSL